MNRSGKTKTKSSHATGMPIVRNIGHHAESPNSDGRSSSSSIDTISIQELIAREAREFLLITPGYDNRFAFYRLLERMDPEVKIAKNYLSLMIQRSYLGPRIDETDETYKGTPDFLSKVNIILSEMQFASRIGSIAKDLIRHGNAFLRVRRYQASPEVTYYEGDEEVEPAGWNKISGSEIIPPDNITILSDRYISNFKEFKGVINSKDYYCIAEKKDRKEGETYSVVYGPEDEPKPDKDGKPPEILLPARDMMHIAWDAEGNKFTDSHNRDTYNIWGESIYESITVYVKAKLTATTDYIRWMRNGMPRWIMTVDLEDTTKLANYEGNTESKIQQAQAAAKLVFALMEDELYYYDDNPDSPTYRKKLPIEPDSIMSFDNRCNMEQKGGAAMPDSSVTNMIKDYNRSIASAMGVPLTLFGYMEGSTFATSKITSKFMAGYGGGLLRTIEIDVKEFLKAEFQHRGWTATPEDWENLYFEYDRDDVEELQARNSAELVQAQKVVQLATAATAMYGGNLLTQNEARRLVAEGVEALKEFGDLKGGESLKPLQPSMPGLGMFGAHATTATASLEAQARLNEQEELEKKITLNMDEPTFEKKVKEAVSDSFAFWIEEIARKVEKGEIKTRVAQT